MLRKTMMIACAALVAACATEGEVVSTTEMGPPSPSDELEGLVSNVGETTVNGEVVARERARGMYVAIAIESSDPGGVHPWHVHQGDCGEGGPIVGDPNAYPPIVVGPEGGGQAWADIDPVLSMDGDYYVNVHESPETLGTIVACGKLNPN